MVKLVKKGIYQGRVWGSEYERNIKYKKANIINSLKFGKQNNLTYHISPYFIQ